MHGIPKAKQQSATSYKAPLQVRNKFYQIFNFIGKQFAQANKLDDNDGVKRSKIQRFNYNPEPSKAEKLAMEMGLVDSLQG